MRTAAILIFTNICIMASSISCGQNWQKIDTLHPDYLDSLCLTMSDEYRAMPENYTERRIYNALKDYWFTNYLNRTYDTIGTLHTSVSEKQLKEGVLLRITEGKFRIEKGESYGETYDCPTEMKETEYFYLNNELIKISVTEGSTDYNAIPANYWITVRQLDLLCQKDKIVDRKAYRYFGDRTELEEEWIEQHVRYLDINENALIQKAHALYGSISGKGKIN